MEPNAPSARKKPNAALVSILVVVFIAILAGTAYAVSGGESDPQTDTTSQVSTSDQTTTTSGSSNGTYTDGSYTATGSYSTPGGKESVTVTATVTGGTITAVDTTGSADGGESEEYQSKFLSNYKSQVVGKSIDEVSLSRVAGSSLTSNGFNDAIDKIADDAKA